MTSSAFRAGRWASLRSSPPSRRFATPWVGGGVQHIDPDLARRVQFAPILKRTPEPIARGFAPIGRVSISWIVLEELSVYRDDFVGFLIAGRGELFGSTPQWVTVESHEATVSRRSTGLSSVLESSRSAARKA